MPSQIQCQRCGHEWQPQKENPKCCPACKSYRYRRPVGTLARVEEVLERQKKTDEPRYAEPEKVA